MVGDSPFKETTCRLTGEAKAGQPCQQPGRLLQTEGAAGAQAHGACSDAGGTEGLGACRGGGARRGNAGRREGPGCAGPSRPRGGLCFILRANGGEQ